MRLSVLAMLSHPSFTHATKNQAKKRRQKCPPSKKEGRRSAKRRGPGRILKRCGAHPASCSSRCGEDRGLRDPIGAGALAFRRPTAARRRISTRLGLGRASWNHRMQAGGPSPAPVQRAPRSPDTRRTGRCPSRPCAQCIAAHHENRPRSASRSTLASGVLHRAGFQSGRLSGDKSQYLGDNYFHRARRRIVMRSAGNGRSKSCGLGSLPSQRT
jgi:hypothetical protein